jgi:acyl-coenzyme A synthetase/AMP-(fatty) acid ligase
VANPDYQHKDLFFTYLVHDSASNAQTLFLYKYPRIVEIVNALPMSATGKI